MTYAILSCISLVFLGASWFLYRNKIELFLCLLIAMCFECFHLLPRIIGSDDYKLLIVLVIIVLFFEGLCSRRLALGRYGWWVISFLVISVFGVFVAWTSGQDILTGIKAAKFIPLVLVYFLLAGRTIQIDKFSTYFILMGLAVSTVALICFVTQGAVNPFLGLEKENLVDHLGRPRITVGQFVISVATVMAFARYKQNSNVLFQVAAIALFAEVLFVQQTRGFIAAIVLSTFVVFALSIKLTPLRISFYLILIGSVLAAALFISPPDLSSLSVVERSKTDFSKKAGSYGNSAQARLNAYAFYWEEIQKNPITGRGIYNFNWTGNTEKRLQEVKGIHLSDIGIVSFVVQAGLIGVIWLGFGLLKIWKDIWHFRNHLVVSCYFIIATFTLPTLDMLFRRDSLFLFAIFLGLWSSIIVAVHSGKTTEGI